MREEQRSRTRARILAALADLIATEHPLSVSMAEVAARAGVSEPTLYRHFATKRELFGALGSMQYQRVTEGIAPGSVAELSEAVRTVFHRAVEIEPVVRWTLAAPDERVPRLNMTARIEMLRSALASELLGRDPEDAEQLLRAVLLATSPMALLYWQDYLGLTPDEAADAAGWLIAKVASG